MSDYKVSEELCKPFCNGKSCPRERKTGSCKYVHNSVVRREALAARRARNEETQKSKKLLLEHARQQDQRVRQQLAYDRLKGTKFEASGTPMSAVGNVGTAHNKPTIAKSKTVNGSKSTVSKPVAAKVVPIDTSKYTVTKADWACNSKPSVVKPVTTGDVKVVYHPVTPPASDAGDALSKETALNNALPPSPPQSPSHPHANALVGVKAAAPIINSVSQNKYTTGTELCRYVHDIAARKQHITKLDRLAAQQKALKLASNYIIPASHVNLDTYDDKLKASKTYASTASHSILVAPKVAPPSLPTAISTTTFWGNQAGLLLWANKNLRSENQFKLLAPYVTFDKLPARNIEVVKKSTESVALIAFELFPLLPGELRNKIWDYAIKRTVVEGRHIRVQYHYDGYMGNQGYGEKVVCRTSSPSLLNVCRESRSLARLFYEATFNDWNWDSYTVINFDHDILFLHTTGPMQLCQLIRLMTKQQCARVKHLVVTLKEYLGDRSHDKNYWARYISYFCNLESLKLMVGSGSQDEPFIKKSYCQGAAFTLSAYLKKRFGKDTTLKAPKVEFEVISALRAHAFNIDELIYMGEGGWGTDKRVW
ncbi:hypothetical protein BKA65DRAFT_537008 [Rhexocercosporidium sp. MPI-PUGE-AT-0058]|nr:hypothetical protein BKA65DRAFT_537008 [Rhexocercosporidium sp. MPI-PUGE-AT-0058]